MVAAPLPTGGLQAGIELHDWTIPVEIWHAGSDESTLDVDAAPDVDLTQARRLADHLRALGVDSLASAGPETGTVHILRIRFQDVDGLVSSLRELAPLLIELEQLAEPHPPND